MRAMVLAAGLGTRLRPLTLDRPKALVEVAGRPLIAYNLLLLHHHGITDVVINLHHQGEALRAALGDGSRFGVRIRYSPEDPLLDTGGAIKNAEALLAADDFLVLNGDTIVDLPLDRLIAAHRTRAATATLVLRHDPEQARYGLIEIDGAERIRRFLGRPETAAEPLTAYMFAGVHMLSPRVFRHMPERGAFSMTRETYPALLTAGEPLYGLPFAGFWRAIDTAADLARAAEALAAQVVLHYLPGRNPSE
jgi:NDP-sugar pyrophosphorylase family protein